MSLFGMIGRRKSPLHNKNPKEKQGSTADVWKIVSEQTIRLLEHCLLDR